MSNLIQNIQNLVDANILSEDVLQEAVNEKLAPLGVSLTAAKVTKRKARPAASSKPAAKSASKSGRAKRVEYADNRNNNHAILLAVQKCGKDGGDSAAIQEQLAKMDHGMETGVFNTTKSNLTNKYSCLKASGKARSKVFTLTKTGQSELDRYEAEFKENGKS